MDYRKDTCEDLTVPRQPTGKTPVHNVRVAPAIWRDAAEVAREEGRTMTDVIVAYLKRYGAPARKRRERSGEQQAEA